MEAEDPTGMCVGENRVLISRYSPKRQDSIHLLSLLTRSLLLGILWIFSRV